MPMPMTRLTTTMAVSKVPRRGCTVPIAGEDNQAVPGYVQFARHLARKGSPRATPSLDRRRFRRPPAPRRLRGGDGAVAGASKRVREKRPASGVDRALWG